MQYDTTKPFSKKNLKPLCEMLVQRLVYHELGEDFGDCSIRYFGGKTSLTVKITDLDH